MTNIPLVIEASKIGVPMIISTGMAYKNEIRKTLKIAQKYGFKQLDVAKEGTYRKFVGVDEQINRLHQYIKVLKFGYGRATDHACEDIRLGILSRNEAKKLVKEYDFQPIGDKYVDDICDFLDYTKNEFIEILEKFRNKDIWDKNDNKNWHILNHLED